METTPVGYSTTMAQRGLAQRPPERSGDPSGGPSPVVSNDCPHRVLVVSADMGGGHNATAAALEEAVERRWPGSELRRIDTLDVMGPGVGPLFRAIYVSNVESTPWLYEFFYSSLWRHRWFARASKRFVGAWCGRRLVSHIDRFDPDLVLSTYPLGSAGLAWLRTHRGLGMPTGAWVSDFAPHPFWVYRELDRIFVVDPSAIPVAQAAEPEASIAMSALPVLERFRPGDQARARHELGLPRDTLVVLVSGGSYAFGDTDAIVHAACSAGDNVTVLVVCGRDEKARSRLDRLGLPPERLTTIGWTDDMRVLIRAADVVLTNAGGATVLEALATGTPVFSTTPIAAHGAANAGLMTVAGLSEACSDLDRLQALLATAAADRPTLQPLGGRITGRAAAGKLEDALEDLARTTPAPELSARPSRPWPMRASDSFFAQVESDGAPQEVGAVLELDRRPDGTRLRAASVCEMVQPRVAGLPALRRVLVRRPLGWRLVEHVDVTDHVQEVQLPGDCTPELLWERVSQLWAEALPEGRPGWQMLLVSSPTLRHSLFAVKLHHSYGDGISALGLLDRLLDTDPADPLRERLPLARRRYARPRPGHLGRLVAGLVSLASRGTAPRHPLTQVHRPDGHGRCGRPLLVNASLRWSEVRRVATALDAYPHELMIGLAAEALCALLSGPGLLRPGAPLRAMVPVAIRPPRLDRVFGNWTGSLAIDLPMEPMPPTARVAAVRDELRRRAERGEPQAAAAVMWLAGRLPDPVHRLFARTVYGRHFFNTIVSYMPAARGPRWLAGAPVRSTTPVLPLAEGVPLTVGIIVADHVASLGILLDDGLELSHDAVQDAVTTAFTAMGGRTLALARSVHG